MTALENLLTVEEVAAKLQMAKATVYAMIHRGFIPAFKIGKCVRISPKSLSDFLKRQEQITKLRFPSKE